MAAAAPVKTETAFEPVEFWNAHAPNEEIRVRISNDPAADQKVKFFAGYFRATEPWQVDAIETYAKHAKRGDSPASFQCTKCGWSTKNSQLFAYHIEQHG